MRNLVLALILTTMATVMAAVQPNTAYAGPDGKTVVAVLPVINNSAQKQTQYMVEMVEDAIYGKLPADRYIVIGGQTLADYLRYLGIEDIGSADPDALKEALRYYRVDYTIRAEIQPVPARQRVHFPDVFLLMKTWVADVTVNFTAVNVNGQSWSYQASIHDWAKHDGVIGFANRHYAIRLALARVLQTFATEPILPE